MADDLETLGVDETPRGTVALRRRRVPDRPPIYELIVNGTFVMDTDENSTERQLARRCLQRLEQPRHLVVGGLGLGFTAAELLGDDRVRHLELVELEPAVVTWLRDGLVPHTTWVPHDPRARVHVDDIRAWLAAAEPVSVDGVLLDVDNGPDYLVHQPNTLVYDEECLAHVARVLRPGGVLAIWSASTSRTLRRRLDARFGTCEETVLTARRGERELSYVIYEATR